MPPRYTEAADADLRAIYRTSVEMFGAAQADRYVAMLRGACDLIADYPRAVRERAEFTPPMRAKAMKSHVILYMVDAEDRVLVVRFRHVREDWAADPVNG